MIVIGGVRVGVLGVKKISLGLGIEASWPNLIVFTLPYILSLR